MTGVILFIDADNQSPAIAPSISSMVLSLLPSSAQTPAPRDERAARADDSTSDSTSDTAFTCKAIIAGNNLPMTQKWSAALVSALPFVTLDVFLTAPRKQSADVRLLFELAHLERQPPRSDQTILIVSRDTVLVEAATLLRERGHRVDSPVQLDAPRKTQPGRIEILNPTKDGPFAFIEEEGGREAFDQFHASMVRCRTIDEEFPLPVRSELDQLRGKKIGRRLIDTLLPVLRTRLSRHGDGFLKSEFCDVLSSLGYGRAQRNRIMRMIPRFHEYRRRGVQYVSF